MPSLREHLANKAAEYSGRAVRAYVDERVGDFALYAGIGLELAIKAKLAGMNPVFLANRRAFTRSAVALHRSATDISLLPTSVSTTDAKDALELLVHLEPNLQEQLSTAKTVAQLRNSEAHMGIASATPAQLADFAQAINVLLNIDAQEFWGEHFQVIDAAINQQQDAIRQAVTAKLARAKIHFEQLEALGDEARASVLSLIEARRNNAVDNDEAVAVECPACHSPALATGESVEEVDVDWDDGVPFAAGLFIEFIASEIKCDACGLHLENSAEIEAADHDTKWLNEEVDVDEWMADHYGDIDEGYWADYP